MVLKSVKVRRRDWLSGFYFGRGHYRAGEAYPNKLTPPRKPSAAPRVSDQVDLPRLVLEAVCDSTISSHLPCSAPRRRRQWRNRGAFTPRLLRVRSVSAPISRGLFSVSASA